MIKQAGWLTLTGQNGAPIIADGKTGSERQIVFETFARRIASSVTRYQPDSHFRVIRRGAIFGAGPLYLGVRRLETPIHRARFRAVLKLLGAH